MDEDDEDEAEQREAAEEAEKETHKTKAKGIYLRGEKNSSDFVDRMQEDTRPLNGPAIRKALGKKNVNSVLPAEGCESGDEDDEPPKKENSKEASEGGEGVEDEDEELHKHAVAESKKQILKDADDDCVISYVSDSTMRIGRQLRRRHLKKPAAGQGFDPLDDPL